ncbi:hypothetical protein HMPREF1624_06449 [Sporothrix schenckii ATCC 58251]|uniref:Protein YIP n=1 Tax=Sporothrix schenckii (strain ATCC 58251 / de Perez 2211183) TaxID=1391915 RepID=U7PQV3_SPOS1|nr:hypothetical protein HMPREF1624_06449 [Sporothrix schenckii ATCC 58251]
MAQYYGSGNPAYGPSSAQNLQFYPSSYSPGVPGQPTAGHGGAYGYGGSGGVASAYGSAIGSGGVGGGPGGVGGVSGRMGEQGGLRTGWLAAFSTEGYDGEPPLLEELGVNFGHIQAKTLAVLNPFQRIDQHLMDDYDLAGPIIFFLLFGTFLLFSGKVHFGYIYGLALLGSISLHIILSLMSPDGPPGSGPNGGGGGSSSLGPSYAQSPTPGYPGDTSVGSSSGVGISGNIAPPSPSKGGPSGKHGRSGSLSQLSSTLTFVRSASVLGYCLLPLVATSLIGIMMPMDTPLGIVLTTAAICWCTYSASGMFCAVGRMRGMRALVAYPLALFYVGFGIMGVFSSRGSGSMAKVIASRTGRL